MIAISSSIPVPKSSLAMDRRCAGQCTSGSAWNVATVGAWGNRRAVIEAWMEAWRRGFPLRHPAVEIYQGGAQQGPVVDRIGPVLTARVVCGTGIGQQEIARAVLRPREVVDAHRFRGGKVALPIQVGVGQRGMA